MTPLVIVPSDRTDDHDNDNNNNESVERTTTTNGSSSISTTAATAAAVEEPALGRRRHHSNNRLVHRRQELWLVEKQHGASDEYIVTQRAILLPKANGKSLALEATICQASAHYTLVACSKGIRLYETNTLHLIQVYGEHLALHGRSVMWQDVLADPIALDLLKKMVQFNPQPRCRRPKCWNNAFLFHNVRKPELEVAADQPLIGPDFLETNQSIDLATLKRRTYEEVQWWRDSNPSVPESHAPVAALPPPPDTGNHTVQRSSRERLASSDQHQPP